MANIEMPRCALDELHRRGPTRIDLHGTEAALACDEVDASDADERELRSNGVNKCDRSPEPGLLTLDQDVAAVSKS